MRNTAAVMAVAFAAVLATACEKDSKPSSEPEASRPRKADGAVVMVIALPSATSLGSVDGALDALQPGLGAALPSALPGQLASLLDRDDLGALAHDRPLWIAAVAGDDGTARFAAFGADARGKPIAIGDDGAVHAARATVERMRATPAADARLTLYPKPLLAAYEGELRGFGAMMSAAVPGQPNMKAMMDAYVNGIIALGRQTDRVELTVRAAGGVPELAITQHAAAGTTLDTFFRAQRPSTLALLDKLPPLDPMLMTMVGEIDLTTLHAAAPEIFHELFAALYGPDNAARTSEHTLAVLRLLRGDLALAARFDGTASVAMSYVAGSKDPAELIRHTAATAKIQQEHPVELFGVRQEITFEDHAFRYRGQRVARQTVTTTGGPFPASIDAYFAAAGDFVVMSTGGGEPGMRASLDAAAGEGAAFEPSPQLARSLADAREHGDSLLMFIDPGQLGAAVPFGGLTMALGFAEGTATLRIRVSPQP